MTQYNPKSLKAEEFINDEEIQATLQYADENKDNFALIDEIIEKARLRKGISHREASVLLACEDENKIKEIYALAEQIKKDFYGDRIVMFAPLYLSNYCVNGCVYCPYHAKNKHICRKKLTQEEVKAEVIALQDMGHGRGSGQQPDRIYPRVHQHHLFDQAQERRDPPRQRQYRRHHRRELQKAPRRRHRHLHSLSGDLPQKELRGAAPHGTQAQLRLSHRGNGPRHGGRH